MASIVSKSPSAMCVCRSVCAGVVCIGGGGYGESDDRMGNSLFRYAMFIVPQNDVKSEICTAGAAQFARDHGENLTWCRATDIVSANSGLVGDAYLRSKKLKWLNKADKACGGLMGTLPLVRGMRVALTTHIDRSRKSLLRGRTGFWLIGN